MAKTYSITLQHPRFVTFMFLVLGVVVTAFIIQKAYHFTNFSGYYDSTFNTVTIYGKDFDLGTLEQIGIHESAHKFWFKDMTEEQRREYEFIFNSSNEYVSEYAKTNVMEDFADTVAYNTICDFDTSSIPDNRREFFQNLDMDGIVKIISRGEHAATPIDTNSWVNKFN